MSNDDVRCPFCDEADGCKHLFPQRFDIPSKPTLIEMFRAFRGFLEKSFEVKGKKLAPAWYADGPDERPELYVDQPHLLAKGRQQS
jgi:hypothetical protein